MHWADEAACEASARALALRPALREAFIELHGTLGAGKTSFVRHLLHALGVQGRIKSPTYAVMESYELPGLPIWHFDFYRFKDPQEFEDAGFRDVFASRGLKLAEWPEQAAGLLPVPDLAMAEPPTELTPDCVIEPKSLAYNSSGLDVQCLQQALVREGFYSGAVSGTFDYATAQAVEAYQTEHDLFARYADAASVSENGGITILVSHRFSTVRMADLIVVLDGAKLAQVGSHEELLAQGGQYAELYTIQAHAYH